MGGDDCTLTPKNTASVGITKSTDRMVGTVSPGHGVSCSRWVALKRCCCVSEHPNAATTEHLKSGHGG